jgi:predicted nucleic acid-binding protein
VKVFFDTSVLVAACVQSHDHHHRALPALRAVMERKHIGMICSHSLLETYSALTMLPLQPRITPLEAKELIRENVQKWFKMINPTLAIYRNAIEQCCSLGFSGGIIYDSLLLACATAAGFDRLYTFNMSHFTRLAPSLKEKISAP